MADDLIICTRNRPDDLARCLDSVLRQRRLPTATTIVDSSDTDASQRVVDGYAARWPAEHTITYVAAERGLTHQRVVGLRTTRQPIVHFVDDDTVLEPNYVDGILATFAADTTGAIGGVGGFVTNQPEHRFWRVDEWLGMYSRHEGAVLPSGRNVRVSHEPVADLDVDWLPGCAMSYRRAVLDLAPPDERVPFEGEDVELSYRVRQHARLVVTPRARIEHLASPTNRESVEASCAAELVSRWRRVRSGVGSLSVPAFWVSAVGQLAWSAVKGVLTLSGERLGIARATARGIREIAGIRRAERGSSTGRGRAGT
jgi:GT2 family glycosyltransferase